MTLLNEIVEEAQFLGSTDVYYTTISKWGRTPRGYEYVELGYMAIEEIEYEGKEMYLVIANHNREYTTTKSDWKYEIEMIDFRKFTEGEAVRCFEDENKAVEFVKGVYDVIDNIYAHIKEL